MQRGCKHIHSQIGGGAGIQGHITICDNTQITGMTKVSCDIKKAGVYSSEWHRDRKRWKYFNNYFWWKTYDSWYRFWGFWRNRRWAIGKNIRCLSSLYCSLYTIYLYSPKALLYLVWKWKVKNIKKFLIIINVGIFLSIFASTASLITFFIEKKINDIEFEILNTQLKAIRDVINNSKIDPKNIDSVGITNQRETTVIWSKKTGKPVFNAIVWQDRRTASFCDDLIKNNKTELIQNKTGLVIDAYFSGTKIKWILDSDPKIRSQANDGELLFGTIDTWLIWNLTNGKSHITDPCNNWN